MTVAALTTNAIDPNDEIITVREFARRVHRDRHTVYKWIREGRMPPGTVVLVQGHLEINWTVYMRSIRPVN
jgi:hypothetical protein